MWTQHRDPKTNRNIFITEASNHPKECPICKRLLADNAVLVKQNRDNEIEKWDVVCEGCENHFIIFND